MTNRIVLSSLENLVDDLRATHGDNLASVVLYGSAAAGDYIELRSDYNLLIALHRISPADLRQAQAPLRDWKRLGHPLPVYFTVAELAGAADVFPIEFHHMQKARMVLFGADPFDSLRISDRNLRHQTEYELRSKLIQLRRLYIPASVNAERLCGLMSDSLASFAALFRPVIMLLGGEPPVSKPECVRATARLLGLANDPFERIFDLRAAVTDDDFEPLTDVEANALFADYVAQIERVIEAVDDLDNKS